MKVEHIGVYESQTTSNGVRLYWRGNGICQPGLAGQYLNGNTQTSSITAPTVQPYGWERWQSMYQKAYVGGAKLRVTATNLGAFNPSPPPADQGTAGNMWFGIMIANGDQGGNSINMPWINQPDARWTTVGLPGGSNSTKTLSMYMSTAKGLGRTGNLSGDPDYYCEIQDSAFTNPSPENAYTWNVGITNVTGVGIQVMIVTMLTYYVTLTNKIIDTGH